VFPEEICKDIDNCSWSYGDTVMMSFQLEEGGSIAREVEVSMLAYYPLKCKNNYNIIHALSFIAAWHSCRSAYN